MSSPTPASCPACGLPIPPPEQVAHLMAAHGYLEVSGAVLPRAAGLARLWERVFSAGDPQAHQRLCQLLIPAPGAADEAVPYLTALEAELSRRAPDLFSVRWREIPRLVRCLRQNDAAWVSFWRLLESPNPYVRELAQELLLPEAGERLASPRVSAAEVRTWLDRLCPGEDVWQKIRLCRRLPRFGVSLAVLKECLRQLEAERPVACPECGEAVPQLQLETHLRRSHRIYQFRGARRSLEQTIAEMLHTLCGPDPDYAAWDTLETLARDEQGGHADAYLAAELNRNLETLSKEGRAAALPGLARIIAESESGTQIGKLLAAGSGSAGRQLALLLADRLPAPLDAALVSALRPLLGDKSITREARLAAAAALLRTTGTSGPAAMKVLQSLVARTGKARAVERLHKLEQLAGKSPAIDELCLRLEEQIRMRCPRCRTQLRRPQMARHLWEEHGLILYGRRVREPWRLVEDLIADYRADGDPEFLMRCRSLGQQLDPVRGLERVYRLFLLNGVEADEARAYLLATAKQRHGSCCPRCYSLVPAPKEVIVRGLNRSHGRLSGGGYYVDVMDIGLFYQLEIETPAGVLFSGPEPENALTYRGATFLLAGPLVVAAILLGLVLPLLGISPLMPVLMTLWLALVAYVAVCFGWDAPRELADRAVDAAWTLLAPRLHADGFSAADSAFLANLALSSSERGRMEVRAGPRERVLEITEKAVAAGQAPTAHLAALRRLAVTDATTAGHDPVRLVVAQVGRCFDEEFPLSYAEHLLQDWESSWWTAGNLARLRVLLCDRAFEAGLEVQDLIEAGRTAPSLGAVLDLDDPTLLAQLRLLWSIRPHRPWDRWGEAVSVFEFAAVPEAGRRLLGRFPDALLVEQALPSILLTGEGVVFEDRLFTVMPHTLELRTRPMYDVDGAELVVGDRHYKYLSEPVGLLGRLERWFRYYFEEFRPQLAGVFTWKAPGRGKLLRYQEAIACPDCGSRLVPRVGEIGMPVERPDVGPPLSPVAVEQVSSER